MGLAVKAVDAAAASDEVRELRPVVSSLVKAALALRGGDARAFSDVGAARVVVMEALGGRVPSVIRLERALQVLGLSDVDQVRRLAGLDPAARALELAGLTGQAAVNAAAAGDVVIDRSMGGAARRVAGDVVGLLAQRQKWPVERVIAARQYERDYMAFVREAGTGLKLMRLERFVGGFNHSVEVARVAALAGRERLRGDQAAVVAMCGQEGLRLLNRIVGEGADLSTAMADPVLAPVVRGSRGGRPRARVLNLLARALQVLVDRRAGPSSEGRR